jgi:osmoprotectant transport system permease protein
VIEALPMHQGVAGHPAENLPARWNPVLAVLSVLAVAALAAFPFLKVAPNRLVSGEPASFLSVLQGPAWLLAMLLALVFAAAFIKPNRALLWFVAAASMASVAGLVWLAGLHATFVAQTASPIARTSLGGAFWAVSLLLGLMAADALQRLRVSSSLRTGLLLAALLPVFGLIAAGWCNDLSIMKEYANRADTFGQTIARHLQIVGVALVPTLAIGLPLGWLARRHARVGASLFPVLNVIQTIPSIALFGLLMAPLALLAAVWPALAKAGISGVGLAPGVIALTLYSLLPVVRGTLAGLEQVPSSVRNAALGMGMAPAQIFWRVDVPLAAPVVLAGVRTATIQMVGLTAVTALIGAGGLGAIMFEGLFSSAQDLVLLGVVPIVVLGVLVDAVFTAIIALLGRQGVAAA